MTSRKRIHWTDDNGNPVVAWHEIAEEPSETPDSPTFECSTEDVRFAIHELTSKQQFVIKLRYGLTDGETYSHEEIADLMGLSARSVRDLETRALGMLQWSLTPRD